MTTNGTNSSEDTEMGEYDGDKVVTMLDVLQEEQDFEEDANAVLGASDDKNCSYNKGYIKRQAIYACMTCSDAKIDPMKRAGVCLACSLTCHENHELIELYTKRNFRCDCGNGKFNLNPCQLNPNKTDLNEDNKYNQNYSGLYCTCHRPYPDPEATTEDEMIQCIICEDWLHASHLDAVVPDEPYSEMICKDCMDKNIFLHDYSSLAIITENVDVDISSRASTLSNGIPESEGTSEKTKDLDVEIKDEAELTHTGNELQNENKHESIINTEGDAVKDCTSELNKVEGEDMSNETNPNAMPVIDERENSTFETVDANTEQTKDKTKNIVTENTPLNPDQNKIAGDIKLPDSYKDSSVNEETMKNYRKDVNKEETEESSPQDTDVTADKVNSDTDMPFTDVNECKDMKTEEELLKEEELFKEEELLKEPTDTEAASSQQEEIKTELTKSNIECDKEPMMDTTKEPVLNTVKDPVIDTASDPAMDTADEAAMNKTDEPVFDTTRDPGNDKINGPFMVETNKIVMDTNNVPIMDTSTATVAVDKNATAIKTPIINENNTSVIDVQQSAPENNETNSEQSSKLNTRNTVDTDTLQNACTEDDSTNSGNDSTKDDEFKSITDDTDKGSNVNVDETVASSGNDNKRKLSMEETDDSAKRIKPNESPSCIRPRGTKRQLKGATFWLSNLRQKLCTCNECISMYKDLSVLFLIDPEDTVAAYEMIGKERGNSNSQYEKGLQALSSLDRIQQINAVTEYNKMREKLCDFLKSFMVRKEIVKEEDIKAFFAGMKPKREPDGVYFCR